MKKNIFFVFIVITFLSIINSYSQNTGKISIHAGTAIPVYEFASDNIKDTEAGGAAIGINAGIKWVYPVSNNGVGFFWGIDFNYNKLQKSVKNALETELKQKGITNYSITYPEYLILPVSAGFNYTYFINDNVDFFLNIGLTATFLKVTKSKVKYDGDKYSTKFDITNKVGGIGGFGFIYNNKYMISANYMGLGDFHIEIDDGGVIGDQKIKIISVSVGYLF